jgi:hypothetical protein
LAIAKGPSLEDWREVWGGINDLLGLANLSRFHPQEMPTGFPAAISAALTALRDGQDVMLSPPWKPAVTHVTVAALGVIGGAMGAGGDRLTLVSPAEAVAEEFVRKLAGGRYDVAMAHLDDQSDAMRARVQAVSDTLRERAGEIDQVEGEEGTIEGDMATASARITTERAGELTMEFRLFRRNGSWKIAYF